ncbi:MAG TPA: universal stress protein [Actinocrinis sp.]|nr:universal stress protein [Actinocrinis sp.]
MSRIVGRVVVGVDGSAGSLQALRYAVNAARSLDTLLVPVLAWLPPGGDLANRRYPVAALTAQWREVAERRLRAAFDDALGEMPTDIDVLTRVVKGAPGQVLIDAADRAGDLLVIGAGRRGPLRHALHASVARQCLAKAGCTVIAVPPNPLARDLSRARRAHWPAFAFRDAARVIEQGSRPSETEADSSSASR